MNFTVIKQMRYREDQICMSNHYLVEEWPFGDCLGLPITRSANPDHWGLWLHGLFVDMLMFYDTPMLQMLQDG